MFIYRRLPSGAWRGPSLRRTPSDLPYADWGYMGRYLFLTLCMLVYIHILFSAHVASPCQPSHYICRWSPNSTYPCSSTVLYGMCCKACLLVADLGRWRFRRIIHLLVDHKGSVMPSSLTSVRLDVTGVRSVMLLTAVYS